MIEHLLIAAKYHIGRALVFVPLLIALYAWSPTGVVLSSVSIALYSTIRTLLGGSREACRCIYESKEITLFCTDGTTQRFKLDDIQCYCKLPLRMGLHCLARGSVEARTLPAGIIAKLSREKKTVQIEASVLGSDLLCLIEAHIEQVPRSALCPHASPWVGVLQGAYVVLMTLSCIYAANLLAALSI